MKKNMQKIQIWSRAGGGEARNFSKSQGFRKYEEISGIMKNYERNIKEYEENAPLYYLDRGTWINSGPSRDSLAICRGKGSWNFSKSH